MPRNPAEARPRVVAVAYSAGHDSTALLHAVVRAAHGLRLEVVALHVHHGLMPQADAWLRHAQRTCARWRAAGWPVRLMAERLVTKPARGQSIEAWARHERRAALARMAVQAGADLILLAQHRHDQAETVLLQALRGGGPAGLAAMPRLAVREGICWARPWLDQPRPRIDAYLRRHRLRWVEDPSNTQIQAARSRLRTAVWPALEHAFPDASQALARCAARAQQADAALRELAHEDLDRIGAGDALPVAPWTALSPARRANALQHWLARHGNGGVPAALLERLLNELPDCHSAEWPWDGRRRCRLYRGLLHVLAHSPAPVEGPPLTLDLSRAGAHRLPGWPGVLMLRPVLGDGLAVAHLRQCEVRARAGAMRFQLNPAGPARALKKQYQALAVPAEQRRGPFLLLEGVPAFVPGLGVDARWRVAPDQSGLVPSWQPD